MSEPNKSQLKVSRDLTIKSCNEIGLGISKQEWDYIKELIRGIKTDSKLIDRRNLGGFCISGALACILAGIGLLTAGLHVKDTFPLICWGLTVVFVVALVSAFWFNKQIDEISDSSKEQVLMYMEKIEKSYLPDSSMTSTSHYGNYHDFFVSGCSHTHGIRSPDRPKSDR